MAWGDKKEALIAEHAALKREVEILREQVVELKEEKQALYRRLTAAHEALVAKESPEAYRDQKVAEELANMPEPSTEELERANLQRRRAEIAQAYINEIEGDFFKDADDMIQQLTRAVGVPLGETASLHGNGES